jgi:hypothetical protein
MNAEYSVRGNRNLARCAFFFRTDKEVSVPFHAGATF